MSTVDSLDIRISAEAKTASATLDKLVGKLDTLAASLNKIDASRISTEISKLSKSMSGINGNIFKSFSDSAKTAETSMNKLAKEASKGINTKATFDISDFQKVSAELSKRFADAGKNIQFSGNLSSLKIQYEKLSANLDKLAEKENKIISVGKESPFGKTFWDLQYDISSGLNQLDTLSEKIKSLETLNPEIKISGIDEKPKFLIEYKKELQDLKNDINTLGEVYNNFKNMPIGGLDTEIESLKTSISELKVEYPQATNVISQFEDELLRLQNIAGSLTKEPEIGIYSIGKEADSSKNKIAELSEKLNQLVIPPINTTDLTKLQNELSKTEAKWEELQAKLANELTMGRMTKSIDDKGFVKLQEEIKKTELRAEALKEKIKEIESASKNTSGFKNLPSVAYKISDSFSKMENASSKTAKAIRKMSLGFKSLLRTVLPFLGIRELFNFGKSSVKNSIEYLETLNYFSAAFGQVAENADLSSFKELGYESADAYYNSFTQRAEELTAKMSGFTVGENGLLQATGNVSLGLDPSQLMNYQAMFGQMASSMGVASETSLKLSQALTEIGADLASVKNLDFEDVWQDMASGMAGMSRTLDKYGVNIRNVNLQQKLNGLGIEANISALNQNDKALLRAIVLLDSTRYAWADLADTINQPANQLRLVEANFQNLSRTVGNLFLPLVQKVLPYVNAFVIALQRLASWIGNLLGIDLSGISSAVGGTDFGDLLDQTDDLESSLGGAQKAADKLNKSLQKFDELNVITTKQDSDTSTGAGSVGGGLLDAAFDESFSEYQAAWDAAFNNLENKAQEIANKIEKAFEPVKKIIEDFAIGDFFQAGKDTSALVAGIFNFFADAIDKVDWEKIGQKIGDFFAGIDWLKILKSVVNLIWQALKAAFELYVGAFETAPLETALISLVAMPKLLKAITASKYITGIKKLGKSTGVLADSFLALKMGISDKRFGTGLKLAIENIRNNLTPLQKASIAITGIVGEFALVKSGFYDLASGADNFVVSLGKIAGGAGLAVGALKLIGLSNPWTTLITGATALVGAIIGINQAQKESLENFAEKRELVAYGDKLSNITERLNEAAEATKERMSASIKYVQSAGIGEMQMAKDLADKYFDLYEKKNLTNEETEEMQRLAQLLIDKAPELNQYYDEQTGLINGTRDAINDVIEARLKEIQLNAVSEKLTEAYKERVDTFDKLAEAAETVAIAQNEMKIAQEEYDKAMKIADALNAYSEITELIKKGNKELGDSYRSQAILNQAIEAGATPTNDLIELQKQLKEILEENGESVPLTIAESTTRINNLLNESQAKLEIFSENYQEAWDSLSNQESALEAVESTISQLSEMMYSGMEGAGEDFGEGYEEGILKKVQDVKNAALKIGDTATNSLEEAGNSAPEIGANFTKGFISGMGSQIKNVKSAAGDIANSAKEAMQKLLEIHSPSKVMFELGDYTMQGFQLGLENLQQPILRSMKDFSYDLQIAPTPSISDIYGSYDYATSVTTSQINASSYQQRGYGQDNAETNRLLREQNNLLRAILEKPNLSNGDIFNAAQTIYKGEAIRRYGDSGTFDPVWG